MGLYLETNSNFGKAIYLIKQYGAEVIPQPASFSDIPKDKALICVVQNDMFEAAGYCYNVDEFRVFSDRMDPRPKTWLLMDKELVHKLTGYKQSI